MQECIVREMIKKNMQNENFVFAGYHSMWENNQFLNGVYIFQIFRSISNTKRSTDFYATHNIQEAGVGKYIVLLSPFLVGGGIVTYAK